MKIIIIVIIIIIIISIIIIILRSRLCFPASAADVAAVNPTAIKTFLANGLITLFINGNPVFSNWPSNFVAPWCSVYHYCTTSFYKA